MSLRTGFCSIVAVALLAVPVLAGEAKTVTYDVRELVTSIKEFEVGQNPATQPAKGDKAGEVVAAVRGVLPADATVREADGQLTVTADAAGQDLAKRFIDQARSDRGRMMMVESRVIRMSDKLIESLSPGLRTAIAAAAFDHGRQPAELDEAMTTNLLNTIIADSGVSQLTAPRLTVFDNQKAFVSVLSDTSYVKGFAQKKIAPDATAVDEPVIDTVQSGVTMNVRSRTTADGSAVALQYNLELRQLLAIDNVKQDGRDIQKPRVAVDQFDGMYVAPRGKTLLVMPTEHVGDAEPGTRTFVLIKATGIVQKNDGTENAK